MSRKQPEIFLDLQKSVQAKLAHNMIEAMPFHKFKVYQWN